MYITGSGLGLTFINIVFTSFFQLSKNFTSVSHIFIHEIYKIFFEDLKSAILFFVITEL